MKNQLFWSNKLNSMILQKNFLLILFIKKFKV